MDPAVTVKRKKKKTVLIVVLVLVGLLPVAVYFTLRCTLGFMGSFDCVIKQDYSQMKLYGKQYVPIVLDGAECELNEKIIEEARVEFAPIIGKLFFSDSVYSVCGCEDLDIVYLQTDYDYPESNYFCLKEKKEYYLDLLHTGEYDDWIATATSGLGSTVSVPETVVKNFLELTEEDRSASVDCDHNNSKNDRSISVIKKQSAGPFMYRVGEILRKNGLFYWYDYKDIPEEEYRKHSYVASSFKTRAFCFKKSEYTEVSALIDKIYG